MIQAPPRTQSISQLPPSPPRTAIAAEPFKFCCKCKVREATIESPGGSFYCEQCSQCSNCGNSIENFVYHLRMQRYVCSCLVISEYTIIQKKEATMLEEELLLESYEATEDAEKFLEPDETYLSSPEYIIRLANTITDGLYVMDLETTGLSPRRNKVITIALGTSDVTWVIDVRSFHSASEHEKLQRKTALQTLFHRDDIVWAGINRKLDWSF